MHAALGIPLSLALAALVMLGTASLHRELWWLVASAIGLTVAADAWLSRLSRFPSRFPLHPAGAFIATVLAWPVSLPWYLHTRWRIRTGRLREDSPAKSQGCAYTLALFVALGMLWAFVNSIADRPLLRDLQVVARALRPHSPASFHVSINNGSNLVVTVDVVPAVGSDSLRVLARRLASRAYFSFRDSSRLNSVTVSYRTVSTNGPLTITKNGPVFEWWPQDLDSTRRR